MATHQHTDLLVALVGQPNCGKSTIFSRLTGVHQRAANYAGVTVEKKSAHFHSATQRIEIVDLPGTYSLTSFTQEEKVTRDFLLLERPEVVVVVLDAANLRRHLFLALQILEMQIPIILCVNMVDVAQRRGSEINVEKIGKILGVPVVGTNGKTGAGIEPLRNIIMKTAAQTDHEPTVWQLDYGKNLEPVLNELTEEISKRHHLVEDFSPRWLAVKLLENNRDARRIVQHHTHDDTWEQLLDFADSCRTQFQNKFEESPQKVVAQTLNDYAGKLERETISHPKVPKRRVSDKIDAYVCHPIFGVICIGSVLFLCFQLVFLLSDSWRWVPGYDGIWRTPIDLCAIVFDQLVPDMLDKYFGLESGPLRSLINDGVIAGIGSILQFVPLIFLVFVLIAVLEQSGFVARISVVLDRLVRCFGLCGQSVLPMILGGGMLGGCAVPAIMATRTMKEPRERILTILVTPMMNCGAKIPVFAVLIAAFFSDFQGLMMACIIFISWAGALFSAWLFSKTIVQGNSLPLLVELPSYLFPNPKTVLKNAAVQCWQFIQKAGTTILVVNLLLWLLMFFPQGNNTQLDKSYASMIGKSLTPVSQLAGFGWEENISLLGGFAAKEVIVSSLGTLHGIGDSDADSQADEQCEDDTLANQLQSSPKWSRAKAVSLLLFVMFYAPCVATCITIRRETRSTYWMLISLVYSTSFAFVIAVIAYQIGRIL
ncbi:MAG: ferrous iron transport protein B [Thermoguttaceae bacterium]